MVIIISFMGNMLVISFMVIRMIRVMVKIIIIISGISVTFGKSVD